MVCDGSERVDRILRSSMLWDVMGPLTLTPKTEKNYGITLWIYNEKIQNDSLVFEFLNEKKRIDDSTEDLTKTSIRVSILSALLSPVTYIITNAAIILMHYCWN